MRGILALALVLVVAGVVAPAAAAQETPTATPTENATATPTATPTPDPTPAPTATATAAPTATSTPANATAAPPEGERIDSNTELVNASYAAETGMIAVTLRSESLQRITVTDAGAFMTGGEIEQRTVTLSEGETATIRIPGTEYEGFVGVSISTSEVLYAVPIEITQHWFRGDPTWETTRVVGAGAVAGVIGMTGYLARKRLRGGEGEVDRVA